MFNTPYKRWLSLFVILFALVACSDTGTAPTTSETGFVFTIDPQSETVSVSVAEASSGALSTQAERDLVPGTDLVLADSSFTFLPGNVLEISVSFQNITDDLTFAQPFAFEPSGSNYVSSTEPTVSDDDLGGDGVLSPGETTAELTFQVVHSGGTFSYVVTASADVENVDGGDPTVDVVGVVPGDFDLGGGSFEITALPRDADGNLITGGVTLDDFSFTDISIAPAADADTPVTDGSAVATDLDIITMGERVSLVLDFDSSRSLRSNDPDRLRVDAGKNLINLLGSADQAAVLEFSGSSTRLLQDFTSDKAALEEAIDSVGQSGGTPFYDSILRALQIIEAESAPNPAVVVFTDGEDTTSRNSFADTLAQARAQSVPVFTIGLGSSVDFTELQTLAAQTGGTFAEVNNPDALNKVFSIIGVGIVQGRVVVTGQATFGSALGSGGDYVVSGNLVTDLGGTSVPTPFSFPVSITAP